MTQTTNIVAEQDQPPTADEILLKQHQSARFSLVPFLAKSLLGQAASVKGAVALPVKNADVLTAETVEAIGEVCRQGVWAALLRHYGWQRAWYAVLAQDKEQQSRLWEADHLTGFALQFSDCSVDAAIAAYNSRLGKRTVDDVVMMNVQRDAWQQSGDILLGLWLYLQHHTGTVSHAAKSETGGDGKGSKGQQGSNQDTGQGSGNASLAPGYEGGYNNNPLVLMQTPELLPDDEALAEKCLSAIPRLLQADLSPLLPWLALGWTKHWTAAEPDRWFGQTKFQAYSNAQYRVFDAWLNELAKQERPDLAVPLLDYFIGLMPGMGSLSDSLLRRFDKMFKGNLRLQERREIAEPWLKVLRISQRLVDLEQSCRQLHPIERECTHRLYLDRFQELEYECIHKEILSVIDSVAPTIG